MVDAAPPSGQGSDMPTMKQLIRAELDSGKSVRDLADASGGRVKFQTFQELSTKPPKQFPKDLKTITGMSLALRVPETTIVLAYAKSLGIPVSSGSTFSLRLPGEIDSLSPKMQDAILAVTRAALADARPVAQPHPATQLRPVPDSAAPPAEGLADAARRTDPAAGKGRSEQGESTDGGA